MGAAQATIEGPQERRSSDSGALEDEPPFSDTERRPAYSDEQTAKAGEPTTNRTP